MHTSAERGAHEQETTPAKRTGCAANDLECLFPAGCTVRTLRMHKGCKSARSFDSRLAHIPAVKGPSNGIAWWPPLVGHRPNYVRPKLQEITKPNRPPRYPHAMFAGSRLIANDHPQSIDSSLPADAIYLRYDSSLPIPRDYVLLCPLFRLELILMTVQQI